MDQAVLTKLAVPIGAMADLIEHHPATPSAWKRNIKPFLTNQATAVTSKKAWDWLVKVFKSGRFDIQAPFAFVKVVLANPWYKFPDEKVTPEELKRRAVAKAYGNKPTSHPLYGPQEKETSEVSDHEYDSDDGLHSSPLPLEAGHERNGHTLDGLCGRCHLEDYQSGEIDCQGPEFCVACRRGQKLALTG